MKPLEITQMVLGIISMLNILFFLPIWRGFFAIRDTIKNSTQTKDDLEKFKTEVRAKFEKMKQDHVESQHRIEKEHRDFDRVLGEFSVAVAELRKTCQYLSSTVENTFVQIQKESVEQRKQFIDIIEKILKRGND